MLALKYNVIEFQMTHRRALYLIIKAGTTRMHYYWVTVKRHRL